MLSTVRHEMRSSTVGLDLTSSLVGYTSCREISGKTGDDGPEKNAGT